MNTIKEEWTRKWNNHSIDSTVAQDHPKNMTYEVYSKCVECSISLSSLTQRHLIVIKNPSNNYRVFNCIISILKQILDSLNNTLLYSFNQLILREMDCFRWTIKDHVAFTINPRKKPHNCFHSNNSIQYHYYYSFKD